jgi:hypothetical protein
VIRGYEAYDGTGSVKEAINCGHQTFFTDLRTARAYAHHASDLCDCEYGVYRYEFIEGVNVC